MAVPPAHYDQQCLPAARRLHAANLHGTACFASAAREPITTALDKLGNWLPITAKCV